MAQTGDNEHPFRDKEKEIEVNNVKEVEFAGF